MGAAEKGSRAVLNHGAALVAVHSLLPLFPGVGGGPQCKEQDGTGWVWDSWSRCVQDRASSGSCVHGGAEKSRLPLQGSGRQGPASVGCTQHGPLPAWWQVPARCRSHCRGSGRDRLTGKLRQCWECHDLPEPFWKGTQQLPGHCWVAALRAVWS